MNSSFLSVVQRERVDFIEEQLKFLINGRLAELIVSPSAGFVEFPVFFSNSLRIYIQNQATSKGLKSRTYRQDGVKYIKVYKGEDGSPRVCLTQLSRKVIFSYLKKDLNLLDEAGDVITEKCLITSSVPVYKFCTSTMNKNGCSPPLSIRNEVPGQLRPSNLRANRLQNRFIDAIFYSQVTILCSDSLEGRIVGVSQCLLDEFARLGRSCRIICTLGHKLSTVHYSELVSSQRGERLGLTVGYQIQLESMSSMSTNLLYTTSRFFLRCLFGNRNETFDATTHIIVDDISGNDVYAEMLLHEIHQALTVYPDLKVVLMCSKGEAKKLQSYFKNGLLLELETTTLKSTNIYYMENIQQSIANNLSQDILSSRTLCSKDVVDVLITKCFHHGRKEDFDAFVELQQEGLIEANVQHSLTKISFGMAACRHDQWEYLTAFMQMGGNMNLIDASNKSAMDWALDCGSERCTQLFHERAFYIKTETYENINSAVQWQEDHRNLICYLVNLIASSDKSGYVLILLPSFVEIVKQERLLKQKITERVVSSTIEILLLHENIEVDEYADLFNDSSQRRIILATDMPMSTLNLKNISFIIDSGRRTQQMDYCSTNFLWISKSCALKRSQLVTGDGPGFCYRLYSKTQFELFKEAAEPDLSTAILGHACLYAKLLAPHTTLRQYFDDTRMHLPIKDLDNTVSVLQATGAFDGNEAITPLGIRIVDIPIDVQLAKVVIFGVILQCLDPVLTIVSILSFDQPMQFLQPPLTGDDGNSHSDLLMLLRVYQRWTDRSQCDESLPSEDTYISNAKLEVISIIRAQLIGILRAMSLIQSNGMLNIHFINQYSNNWPLVKAAFVAGMYGNICQWNQASRQLIGKHNSSMELSNRSALLNNKERLHQLDLIMYQATEKCQAGTTTAVCNTIISSPTAVLFAGNCMPNKIELIPFLHDDDSDSEKSNCDNSDEVECYYINEWLFAISSREDACLLFELRCKFINFFNDVVRHFDDAETFRKTKNTFHEKFDLLATIAYLLQLEDEACNLPEPKRVGERPNTFSSKFKKNRDKIANLRNSMIKDGRANSTSKSYFIIKVQSKEEAKMLIQRSKASWNQLILKCTEQSSVNVFLLLDGTSVFRGVLNLCFDGNKYFLIEIASRDVAVNELKAIYVMNGMESFRDCYDGQELNSVIGSQFLELFL